MVEKYPSSFSTCSEMTGEGDLLRISQLAFTHVRDAPWDLCSAQFSSNGENLP